MSARKSTKAAAAEAAAEAVAYVGPDIKHIARRGTVYTGGLLPDALNKKIEEIPAIKGLIIPVSKLAAAQVAAAKPGTAINNLYSIVAAKLE